jgi:hypothetical protein
MAIAVSKLLDAITATATGAAVVLDAPAFHGRASCQCGFQAIVTGTGAVGATVLIEVSNDGTNWETVHTITLSGTTSDSDGVASEVPWAFVRARCTALSGTGAALTVLKSVVRT